LASGCWYAGSDEGGQRMERSRLKVGCGAIEEEEEEEEEDEEYDD
jgi:hypothetical protein